MDTTHLQALITRLANERERLASETDPKRIALRRVWVAQCEREIASEERFLGMTPSEALDMTDDELLAELMG